MREEREREREREVQETVGEEEESERVTLRALLQVPDFHRSQDIGVPSTSRST